MRRDTIFYQLFAQSPALLFELLETAPANASEYRFDAVAVKEPRFEIDGVFLPPETDSPGVIYFCEVQFQKDNRLFLESGVYRHNAIRDAAQLSALNLYWLIFQSSQSSTMLSNRGGRGCTWMGCLLTLIVNFAVWSVALWQIIRGIGWFAYAPPHDFGLSMAIYFGIGLFQLLYLFPLALILRNRGKMNAIKGIAIGAVITAILNAIGLLVMIWS
ncbi:MAG: DUF2887 domain-containing protein [Kovacikia sp.]